MLPCVAGCTAAAVAAAALQPANAARRHGACSHPHQCVPAGSVSMNRVTGVSFTKHPASRPATMPRRLARMRPACGRTTLALLLVAAAAAQVCLPTACSLVQWQAAAVAC